ncbi:inversin isoform X3 [Sardina pilchardus]|uniref:inversin isoform X3 n=1 Tax=Sardina pilchardus TaxID=27697 RepID=UPI002E161EC0
MAVPPPMSSPDPTPPGPSPLSSQVHAAAVNGDKSTLQKLITADPALRDSVDGFGRTPLMYCVLADRLDCAEALLKAGAAVNQRDHSHRTALHLAAQKGNTRFMKLLLSRRADWLLKDREEITALHLATRHPSLKPLALLLRHMGPGEVDTQDKNKQTALHWSAFYNHAEHVKLLIKHDSNIGIPDSEGKIPLHWAAHNTHPNATHTVRCILEAAPTESLLNWQDYEGRTPLHFAVAVGNEEVVKALTSYEGCSVTAYDNLFRTPLHWAALLGHSQIVHLLLERNKSGSNPSDSQGATPLHYGAQSNYADTVAVFVRHPSVRDEPDLEGRTAFMWAAGKGSDDVIRTMLDLKADLDINMADKYGGTALHAASLSGHVSTVTLLLERGAAVDPLDVMRHTPLFRACEMGHRDVILTLIKGGAQVDLVDIDGHSALHWAALGGNAEVCEVLMENGLGPDLQDSAGRTPLQCAAYAGYINCMALLLQHDADANIQDKEGRTALHWSCNNGYLDAVKLLLGCGAFPNHMENNEERYTPLDYALLGEHQELTQYLLEHGAMSIAAIQDIAACSIQALFKGYRVRRAFRERKNLLMRHEQLRKDAAKKREEERRREAEQQLSLAGSLDQQLSLADQAPSVGGKRRVKAEDTSKRGASRAQHRKSGVETEEVSGRARVCVPAMCVSAVVASERLSPAGSSRPGSAKPQLPIGTETQPQPQPRVATSRPSGAANPHSASSSASASASARQRLTDRDGVYRRERERKTDMERERRKRDMEQRRNRAAKMIQSAWRRHRTRALLREVLCRRHRRVEPPEVTALVVQLLWERPVTHGQARAKARAKPRAPPTKSTAKKSTVLQNIYGGSQTRRGGFNRITTPLNSSSYSLLPLKNSSTLSGMECVRVDSSPARQYSYHMRPLSKDAQRQSRTKN